MKTTVSLLISLAFASTVSAQGIGSLYRSPAASEPSGSDRSPAPSKPASVVPAALLTQVSQNSALPFPGAADPKAATNPPARIGDVAPPPTSGKATPAGSDAQPKPGTTVQRRPDGSRVIRTTVTPAMAEAEANVAAAIPVPALGAQPAQATTDLSRPAPTSGVTLADVKPLPKWVTSSLDRTSSRNQILVLPGVTEIVRIARGFPNRFTTPFDAAEVVTTDEQLTHDGVGGSIIVATSSDKPIGIFIQDRNSDRAIPLVLVPEDIPQRDIKLLLDDSWGPPVLRNVPDTSNAALPGQQSEYVEYIKSIMRALAKGEVPDGHALSPLQPEQAPQCRVPGVTMRLGQMLEGSRSRIAIYQASNTGTGPVAVQESGCYRSGVLAVAAFPRPVLEPGQDTEVYVVLRKETSVDRPSAKRRPLLVSQ